MVKSLESWDESDLERQEKPSYEELFTMVNGILVEIRCAGSPYVVAVILAIKLKISLLGAGFSVPEVMHHVIAGSIDDHTLNSDSIVRALQRKFPDFF